MDKVLFECGGEGEEQPGVRKSHVKRSPFIAPSCPPTRPAFLPCPACPAHMHRRKATGDVTSLRAIPWIFAWTQVTCVGVPSSLDCIGFVWSVHYCLLPSTFPSVLNSCLPRLRSGPAACCRRRRAWCCPPGWASRTR